MVFVFFEAGGAHARTPKNKKVLQYQGGGTWGHFVYNDALTRAHTHVYGRSAPKCPLFKKQYGACPDMCPGEVSCHD